jgi:oxaloacetate decarboxylase alpha subunit/pyruvate carboxylase subunit B
VFRLPNTTILQENITMSDQIEVKMTTMNYDKDRPAAENPVKIEDLSLRDGHQSLFATRGRTEDMIPVADMMDEVGFWAMEVWGGATFDTMHRFLNEDPWERIRTLKRYIKKTPFSMLLRAQNLVGYRNYADDVAKAFVERTAETGWIYSEPLMPSMITAILKR